MKFIRNAIILVVLSTMINLCLTGLIRPRLVTSRQDWGGGNIHYLDRQNVNCPPRTALDAFQLYRPTSTTLAYRYNCRLNCSGMKGGRFGSGPGKTYKGKTRPNKTSGNLKRSANYLDRHHVYCRNGYALQQFKMGRSGRDIYYGFTCTAAECKSRPTTYTQWQSGGNNEVIYLDRQLISMQSHSVVTGFKLETKYGGGTKYRYKIDYCMLHHPPRRPTPRPAPRPIPRPVPRPTPRPAPRPIPRPVPRPIPRPAPRPIPRPAPRPIPRPAPRPIPRPAPRPIPPKLPIIKLPQLPKLPKLPKIPTPLPRPVPIPAGPISTPPGPPATGDVTSAPLTPAQIANNAKGKLFCNTNCDLNPAVRVKSCVEPSGLVPCKRCTNKPQKTDPAIKQVCELVCNAHIPNSPCDFYGYLNNKKKAYNIALLARFGLKILRRFKK
jgi:hypothetical protein